MTVPDHEPQELDAPASDRPSAYREPRYPCWCDGEDGCDNLAAEPFGLCATCRMYRHGRMPRMGLTAADMEEMAQEVSGGRGSAAVPAGAERSVTDGEVPNDG